MVFVVFLIVTMFLAISSCEPRHKLAPVVNDCSLLLPVENNTQTVFFDMDIRSNTELKTCILKNSLSERSVLILNLYGTNMSIKLNATRKFVKTSDNPNVIMMTTHLTPKMVDSDIMRFFIQSNWSLLYIILTGDKKFVCTNGTMIDKDLLLLDRIMNTLWQKFQIMRVGLVFPFACKGKMVIYNGKRPSSRNLYDRPVKLIDATNSTDLYLAVKKSADKLADDYPMQGNIFYRYPTSIKNCKKLHYYVPFNFNVTRGYCGLDGMVMHDFLTHFKFNVSYTENESCDDYGYVMPGNVSGSLGCIIRKELDISFNSRFMTLYSDEHIYYLHYVSTDSLCALLRKTDIVPVWHGVYNVFSLEIWMLISAALVAIGGIMWVTAKINKTLTGQKTMTFWFYVYDSVMTTIVGCTLMKTKTLLIIRGMCFAGSILFLAVYQGHMSLVYTTSNRMEQIKTLKQLYSSGATLYTSPEFREISKQLQNPEDKLEEAFFNRSHLIQSGRLDVVMNHKFATTLDRKTDVEMEILEQYTDEQGKPMIDIVDECFHTYYLSYIARSRFPFFEELQIFTERLKEAGLPTMYYKWTQQMLNIPKLIPEKNNEPRPFVKIKLSDQRVAFAILFIGTIVSVIVFAAEMWKGRRRHCKRKS